MRARYDEIGGSYGDTRRPDRRIAARLRAAIGDAHRVLNVGAGSGSYEPHDRFVVAVEPATTMIAQRPTTSAPVIRAFAEALPVRGDSFDVAVAVLTVHHWEDLTRGLDELQRVARRQVVFTWDPAPIRDYWLVRDYLPEIADLEAGWDPYRGVIDRLDVDAVESVPVPADCTDGFLAAFWKRPHAYLDPRVRASMSGLALLDPEAVERAVRLLADDLDSGAWLERHHELLDSTVTELDVGYRLITATRT